MTQLVAVPLTATERELGLLHHWKRPDVVIPPTKRCERCGFRILPRNDKRYINAGVCMCHGVPAE